MIGWASNMNFSLGAAIEVRALAPNATECNNDLERGRTLPMLANHPEVAVDPGDRPFTHVPLASPIGGGSLWVFG
jgi:hypothetical protein